MVSKSNETRRSFIKASSAGMAALVLTSSQTAQTFAANEKMTVGIVGCGGRGHFILRKFYQNAENQFHVVAIQDPFQDRLEAMKDRFEIPDAKVFQGLHAYREMMETAFDAALITCPPYAHPDQVQRAVAAGKHVWLAKPVAVDVPGCQSILESSKKAQGKTNFLVDFQTRN
ncbi:MAG: Gfo/Idh/MocA family oxidoreductase, partial [bacterium]|nr:Gfo/Idh/MocA family oxidoreductase [bacterium]